MARYRIVCTEKANIPGKDHHPHHPHITSVGTSSDPACVERKWLLDEVLTAMKVGDTFFTKGETSQKVAEVESYHCERCGGMHIKSKADHVKDNNLDEMKHCPVTPGKRPSRDEDDCKPQPDRRHA